MELEFHENKKESLFATIGDILYDSQAETWVGETFDPTQVNIFRWVLRDKQGVRCIWERKLGEQGMPKVVWCADRYTGEREAKRLLEAA